MMMGALLTSIKRGHGRTGIQTLHYEMTAYTEPKLKALKILERWVMEDPALARV